MIIPDGGPRRPSSTGTPTPLAGVGPRVAPVLLPRGAGATTHRGYVTASLVSLALIVLAWLAPTVALWLARGVLVYAVAVVLLWAGCVVARRRAMRRLDRHVQQALRVVR